MPYTNPFMGSANETEAERQQREWKARKQNYLNQMTDPARAQQMGFWKDAGTIAQAFGRKQPIPMGLSTGVQARDQAAANNLQIMGQMEAGDRQRQAAIDQAEYRKQTAENTAKYRSDTLLARQAETKIKNTEGLALKDKRTNLLYQYTMVHEGDTSTMRLTSLETGKEVPAKDRSDIVRNSEAVGPYGETPGEKLIRTKAASTAAKREEVNANTGQRIQKRIEGWNSLLPMQRELEHAYKIAVTEGAGTGYWQEWGAQLAKIFPGVFPEGWAVGSQYLTSRQNKLAIEKLIEQQGNKSNIELMTTLQTLANMEFEEPTNEYILKAMKLTQDHNQFYEKMWSHYQTLDKPYDQFDNWVKGKYKPISHELINNKALPKNHTL